MSDKKRKAEVSERPVAVEPITPEPVFEFVFDPGSVSTKEETGAAGEGEEATRNFFSDK